jgi:hypothetical protein
MEQLTADDIVVAEEALKFWERHHQNIADELCRSDPIERARRQAQIGRAREVRRKLMAAQ